MLYNKMLEKIRKIVNGFLFACGIILLAVGFAQVLFRYVFSSSLPWSEELMRYLNIWTIYIGISVLIPTNGHVAVDAVLQSTKGTVNKMLRLFIDLLCFAFYIMIAYIGMKFALSQVGQISTATKINMTLVYMCFPIGGVLSVLFTLGEILKLYAKPAAEEALK